MNTDTQRQRDRRTFVGFQSIHYFQPFFKAKENCTPMEYRMRNGQSRYSTFSRGGSSLLAKLPPAKKQKWIICKVIPAVLFYNEAVDKTKRPGKDAGPSTAL